MADKFEWIKKLTKRKDSEKSNDKEPWIDKEKAKKVEESFNKRGFQKLVDKLFGK